MAAQYLLRFDDICPTMNWSVWQQVEGVLAKVGVRPLLAVIPDNQDDELRVDSPRPDFWDRVREWQASGWSIGLHGFQHRYETASSGILGRNRYSEFAGLSRARQEFKLREALRIFRGEGVRADAWIAPAHSFDQTTVELLAELGIPCISDGYSMNPHICDRGLLWVPQQMGSFRWMPFGTWTVCLHTNPWTPAAVASLETAVSAYRGQITSLPAIAVRYGKRPQSWTDEITWGCMRALREWRR